MPDFSLSHPTISVRYLKARDYSLNRSSKDFEKSKVGFDVYLGASFADLELTGSFPWKGEHTLRALAQVMDSWCFCFPLCGVLYLSGLCA